MTLISIAKKLANYWLINMAKGQMAQKLVIRETTSIASAHAFNDSKHTLCCQCD